MSEPMKSQLECDALVARIKNWVARSDTYTEIARAVGVVEKSVRNATAPDWDPRVSTLRKFEVALRRGDDRKAA